MVRRSGPRRWWIEGETRARASFCPSRFLAHQFKLIAQSPSSISYPMPIITPTTLKEKYDVIVVGSGAAGGQTAYTLTLEGAKVLMLEAGRNYVPETETPMFQTP